MPALVLTYYPKGNVMEYLKETKPSDESKFLLVLTSLFCAYRLVLNYACTDPTGC